MFTPTSNYPKFDVHAHVLPADIPDFEKQFGYGGFVKLQDNPKNENGSKDMIKNGRLFRTVEKNCFDTDTRIAEMDACHVNVQAVSTVPVMFHYWAKAGDAEITSRFINNDIYKECRKYPSRLVPVGTLPLQNMDLSLRELKRCYSELGMRAIEIGSNVNGKNLDDPHFEPFFKEAESLGMTLFVHPWDMHNWDGRLSKYWMPWLVGMPSETAQAICCILMGGILNKFPKLKLCFAHGCGSYPQIAGRVSHGFKVRPDLCATACETNPSQFHGKFYADSLVHDPSALNLLVNVVGKDKVCLGTDYPFPLGELEVGKVVKEYEYFNETEKQTLLYDNAINMLGLDEHQQTILSKNHW